MTHLMRMIAVLALALGACASLQSAEEIDGSDVTLGKGDDPHATDTGVKLRYQSYDVLFTNPLCKTYSYDEPVASVDGTESLTQRPKNVFCSSTDAAASAARPTSPQYRLLEWIRPLGQGDEIFLAYLSFSNAAVGTALCDAVGRGAKVTFILDATSPASERLATCGGTVLLRGHQGTIGYAHNKLILINPNLSPAENGGEYMKMAFSSGNMSSGVVLHHENWHFIEVARESYFAEAHRCLMQAQLDEQATSGKAAYRTFINDCRAAIEYPQEDDIRAYFVPVREDSQGITSRLVSTIGTASSVDIGVHRFCYTGMVDALAERLEADESFRVRMVADDDLYWLKPLAGEATQLGDNLDFEADNVARLAEVGGDRYQVRYFETNSEQHLLHHNKYLLYRDEAGKPFALLCGAANLTGTGFNDNFENIYWVKIPKVLEAFDTQFARVWDGQRASPDEQDPPRATPPEKMPVRNAPANP